MAEQAVSLTKRALQQLKDHVTCSICFNSYNKPRLLNCAHVFCQECIQRLVKPVRRGRSSVACPFCSKETVLPQGGAVSLQEAFYVNSLAEIRGTLEKVEAEQEEPVPSAPYWEEMPSVPISLCSVHQKELEFYCETCSVVICAHCTVKQHRDHQFELKDDKVSESRRELLTHLEPQLLQFHKMIDGESRLIVDERSSLEAKISMMFENSLHEIKSKKANLINEVYRSAQEKLQKMVAMKKTILHVQGELKYYASLELTAMDHVDVIKAKIADCSQKVAELKLETSDVNHFIDVIEAVGQGDENYKIFPIAMEIATAQVGKTFVAVVQNIDQGDQPTFECQVIPKGASGIPVCCDVTPISDQRYEITFLPNSKGKHRLHIKAGGKHITGSPFPLLVTLPVEQVGTPLQVIDEVIGPFGIAVDMHGCVVVAEYGLHRVSIYDNGKKISSFGCHGSGDGEFIHPRGVAIDSDGNIFVSDEGNSRLQKFTSKGVFMSSAGNEGTGPLEFSTPSGIGYNLNDQKLYVADTRNCRIQVLNSDLSFSHFIGSKGTEQGKLANPWDIAFDRSGCGYVADTSNHRIQVFTAKGYFLYSITGNGNGKGEFKSPSSVAVDEDGTLYIADLKNDKIVAYTTDGDFKATFGRPGSEPGQFKLPHGLAIDNESGKIYVSDMKNKRIQCF